MVSVTIRYTMYRALVVSALLGLVVADVTQPWWNSAVYYRVVVDSFKDTDDDGLGDLKGLAKKISYIRAIGADAVILSPLVTRSTNCSTPGTLDFSDIDLRYGNLDDFNSLLEKAKKIELKVVVSLPPQTASVDSEWFRSSAERIAGYEDWIVWKDGNADDIPLSQKEDGIDEWTWHDGRNAFWAGNNKEVVINLCSESAAASLSNALCNWLKRGASGLLLNPDFFLEPKCGALLLKKLTADAMSCARSAGLDAPVILVETALHPELAASYYGDGAIGANNILSRALTSSTRSTSEIILNIFASIVATPEDITLIWMTSKFDGSRIATRYGSEMVDAINLLTLILPGSAMIQQGDELGTADTLLDWVTETNCWPYKPEASKSPFPWDDSMNAGFTNGEPWIPLAPNYRYANAKAEFANDFSHVGLMKVTAALRKSPAFGSNVEIKRLNGAVAVLRWGPAGSLLLVSNLGKDNTEVQLSRIPGIPAEMTVATSSSSSSYSMASHLVTEKMLKLAPGETVLLVGGPRHCGGPGPVDKIANKLSEGWQKINKYFSTIH